MHLLYLAEVREPPGEGLAVGEELEHLLGWAIDDDLGHDRGHGLLRSFLASLSSHARDGPVGTPP
jgi:hypothetical protein